MIKDTTRMRFKWSLVAQQEGNHINSKNSEENRFLIGKDEANWRKNTGIYLKVGIHDHRFLFGNRYKR